jgi:zinc transporter ZupT
MNPRWAFFLAITAAVIVIAVLCSIFPAIFDFVKAFSGDLRFFWWVILLVALAVWLILWAGKNKK